MVLSYFMGSAPGIFELIQKNNRLGIVHGATITLTDWVGRSLTLFPISVRLRLLSIVLNACPAYRLEEISVSVSFPGWPCDLQNA